MIRESILSLFCNPSTFSLAANVSTAVGAAATVTSARTAAPNYDNNSDIYIYIYIYDCDGEYDF